MKKTLVTLFIVALLASCNGVGSGDKPSTNPAQTETVSKIAKKAIARIQVDGMTCAMGCAKAIENNLKDLSGVKFASVDFEKNEAKVEFNTTELSKDDLIETITSTNGGGKYIVTTFELEELVQNGLDVEAEEETPVSQENSNEKNVEINVGGSEAIAKKIEMFFPSIFRALLNIY